MVANRWFTPEHKHCNNDDDKMMMPTGGLHLDTNIEIMIIVIMMMSTGGSHLNTNIVIMMIR